MTKEQRQDTDLDITNLMNKFDDKDSDAFIYLRVSDKHEELTFLLKGVGKNLLRGLVQAATEDDLMLKLMKDAVAIAEEEQMQAQSAAEDISRAALEDTSDVDDLTKI